MRIKRQDSIIVRPDNLDPTKEGGAFEVVSVGVDVKEVQVGDGVVTVPQAILKIVHEGDVVFITKEQNVMAILRKEAIPTGA
jgi:co-chaperonin GroES (HSP10)